MTSIADEEKEPDYLGLPPIIFGLGVSETVLKRTKNTTSGLPTPVTISQESAGGTLFCYGL